jgi:hypothetical protein
MPIDPHRRRCIDQIFGPGATAAGPPPLPTAVGPRLRWAVGVLHDWNTWITQARRMEAVACQPGRYEYDLRYTDVGAQQRQQMAWEHGIPPEQLYAPLGGKPGLLPEAPAVG